MFILERFGYTPETFRARIKQFRIDGGMTQEQFADYLGGLSVATVSKWERGLVVPTSRAVLNRLVVMKVIPVLV